MCSIADDTLKIRVGKVSNNQIHNNHLVTTNYQLKPTQIYQPLS